ncbi:MAG: hypothetical protein WBW33_08350 [Bryobacteraceae bacterium]
MDLRVGSWLCCIWVAVAEFEEELALATQFYLAAKKENRPVDPCGLGFEFSISEVERHAEAQIHHQTIAKMKRAS